MNNFHPLIQTIKEAGFWAAQKQKSAAASIKEDGSVVTEVDITVQKMLTATISTHFSGANIVAEETIETDKPEKAEKAEQADKPEKAEKAEQAERAADGADKLTFVIDPIDGTDGYSQGLPGWCIAVGILDGRLQPLGGLVFAPNWETGDPKKGLFLVDLPGEGISINEGPYKNHQDCASIGYFNKKQHRKRNQIMIGSKTHHHFNFSSYPGKIRSIGSSILHLLAPLLYSQIGGTILTPCKIWDMAPAHSFLIHSGLVLETYSKKEFSYQDMVKGALSPDYMLAGFPDTITLMRRYFVPY